MENFMELKGEIKMRHSVVHQKAPFQFLRWLEPQIKGPICTLRVDFWIQVIRGWSNTQAIPGWSGK